MSKTNSTTNTQNTKRRYFVSENWDDGKTYRVDNYAEAMAKASKVLNSARAHYCLEDLIKAAENGETVSIDYEDDNGTIIAVRSFAIVNKAMMKSHPAIAWRLRK